MLFKMREVYAAGWVCFLFSRADSGHGSVGIYQDRMHYFAFRFNRGMLFMIPDSIGLFRLRAGKPRLFESIYMCL